MLQFGECARATRTAGSYGGGIIPATSACMLGNLHPEAAIPMDRGLVGNHTGATKERAFIWTAPRVQPHEAIPEEYTWPAGVDKWLWVDLHKELAELSGLGEYFHDPEGAIRAGLQPAPAPAHAPPSLPGSQTYVPHSEGCCLRLPDSVESRVRWVYRDGLPVAQLRIANRSFNLPEEHD
eukprot:4833074-Karenia_brevis.AAC.1